MARFKREEVPLFSALSSIPGIEVVSLYGAQSFDSIRTSVRHLLYVRLGLGWRSFPQLLPVPDESDREEAITFLREECVEEGVPPLQFSEFGEFCPVWLQNPEVSYYFLRIVIFLEMAIVVGKTSG